jgi:hypothetical protein
LTKEGFGLFGSGIQAGNGKEWTLSEVLTLIDTSLQRIQKLREKGAAIGPLPTLVVDNMYALDERAKIF